jgi:hypothetical protein
MGVTLGKCSTHPSLFGNGIIWEGPIMVIALSLSLSLSLSEREREILGGVDMTWIRGCREGNG